MSRIGLRHRIFHDLLARLSNALIYPRFRPFRKVDRPANSLEAREAVRRIKYREVLQISSKSAAISFVPDPGASPYASWKEVESIGRGEFVQVNGIDNRMLQGVLFRTTPDSISLMRRNRETVIPASEVLKVYRVKGDPRKLPSKIVSGGSRGEDIEPWLGLGDAQRVVNGRVDPIAAAIGATIFALPIGKTSRVLVFSR